MAFTARTLWNDDAIPPAAPKIPTIPLPKLPSRDFPSGESPKSGYTKPKWLESPSYHRQEVCAQRFFAFASPTMRASSAPDGPWANVDYSDSIDVWRSRIWETAQDGTTSSSRSASIGSGELELELDAATVATEMALQVLRSENSTDGGLRASSVPVFEINQDLKRRDRHLGPIRRPDSLQTWENMSVVASGLVAVPEVDAEESDKERGFNDHPSDREQAEPQTKRKGRARMSQEKRRRLARRKEREALVNSGLDPALFNINIPPAKRHSLFAVADGSPRDSGQASCALVRPLSHCQGLAHMERAPSPVLLTQGRRWPWELPWRNESSRSVPNSGHRPNQGCQVPASLPLHLQSAGMVSLPCDFAKDVAGDSTWPTSSRQRNGGFRTHVIGRRGITESCTHTVAAPSQC